MVIVLDKQSEKVLKIMISKYDGNSGNDVFICGKDVDMPNDTLNSLCDNLLKNGYFSMCKLQYHKDNLPVQITPSYKGLSYFECKKTSRREFIKQLALSKASDILVSAITAILTYFSIPIISNLISMLLNNK